MRKDYVPIDAAGLKLEEAAFVEQYWTSQWKDRGRPPDVSDIARRDEYRVIKPYLDRLPKGSRILDGGCGLGEWTLFFADQGLDAVGIDISEATITRLNAWFPQQRFLHGDLRHTSFADASFDAYFSWGTFEHFESGLGECLEEAYRVVKPGGWLFITVPFHNRRLLRRDGRRLEQWDEHFDADSGYRQRQRFYQWRLTRPELKREMELRGFRVHQVAPVHKDTGVGRWLQWDVRAFAKGSTAYRVALRAASLVMPASYINHMILAVAQRR